MSIILAVLLLLLVALIVGEAFERVKLPAVVGEIITGIVFGPTVLNLIKPSAVLSGFSEISLFFIVLLIGVEVTTETITRNVKKAALFCLTSFIVPVIAMIIVTAGLFKIPTQTAVIVCVASGIPSISIISVLISRYNLLNIEAGRVILSSVIITDIIGFTVASGFSNPSKIVIGVFGIIAFLIVLFLIDFQIRKHSALVSHVFESLRARERGEKVVFGIVITSGLLIASLLEFLGVTYVLGAFFAGMLISDVVVGEVLQGILTRTLRRLNDSFFIPLFFSIAGLSTTLPDAQLAVLIIVLVALSCVIGGILDYFYARKSLW